jgi:hypothetical protein
VSAERSAASVADLLPENLTETFDAIRGDLHLYELGEVSFKSMLRGLRESVAVLEAKEAKRDV